MGEGGAREVKPHLRQGNVENHRWFCPGKNFTEVGSNNCRAQAKLLCPPLCPLKVNIHETGNAQLVKRGRRFEPGLAHRTTSRKDGGHHAIPPTCANHLAGLLHLQTFSVNVYDICPTE